MILRYGNKAGRPGGGGADPSREMDLGSAAAEIARELGVADLLGK
jgi:hypothetical protein